MKFKVEIVNNELLKPYSNLKEMFFETNSDSSILKFLIDNKIGIDHSCGGNATCGTCQIEIISGTLSDKEELENEFCNDRQMKENERLSCQTIPKSDLKIIIKNLK